AANQVLERASRPDGARPWPLAAALTRERSSPAVRGGPHESSLEPANAKNQTISPPTATSTLATISFSSRLVGGREGESLMLRLQAGTRRAGGVLPVRRRYSRSSDAKPLTPTIIAAGMPA